MIGVINHRTNYNTFKEFIKSRSKFIITYDIETFQYNYSNALIKTKSKKIFKPTLLKNKTFTFSIAYIDNDIIHTYIFNTFIDFFNLVESSQKTNKIKIKLVAQNNNKYDNHFLIQDCVRHLNFKLFSKYSRNSINHSKEKTLKNISKEDKENGVILEKRVKSSNNVEFTLVYKNIKMDTEDFYLKTHISIDTLGKKMLDLNLIDKQYLKTKMDYTKYNLDKDMNIIQETEYSKEIFEGLKEDEFVYIENDVIVLILGYYNYSKIFIGFDINKLTLSSNILEEYLTNDLATFQLKNELKTSKFKIDYSNFIFGSTTLYDYFVKHFKGGLNIYNDEYVGQIIYDKMFSIDINSSYPYVMHKEKFPTFLLESCYYEKEKKFKYINDDYYYLFTMDKFKFNEVFLDKIQSLMLRKIIVKYYSSSDNNIYFNSNTLRILTDICKIEIDEFEIISYIKYECELFGARDIIEKNYKIKCLGKCDYKMEMISPYEYTIDKESKNEHHFTEAEIDLAKLYLNGIYGLPSLRKFFNMYYMDENGDYINHENNHKNNSRNLLFSLFVTSKALYNLLEPLKYLEAEEIDTCLIYADTDSLYLKKEIQHKIPKEMFDGYALGKWDIENQYIYKFYVLNHKKYAYQSGKPPKKKSKKNPNNIKIRSGGIRGNSFDTNLSFEKFIDTQFSNGVVVTNTKSIMNNQHTISIYESETKLEVGWVYPIKFNNLFNDMVENIINKVKENNPQGLDDVIYIETPYGSISQRDLYKKEESVLDTSSLDLLSIIHEQLKTKIKES